MPRTATTLAAAALSITLVSAAALAQEIGPGATFVGDLNGVLWAVDVADGAATRIGDMGLLMRDIAISANGRMFGVGDDEALYSIDPTTAIAQRVGSIGPRPVSGLDFSPDGRLFLATSSGSSSVLATLDLDTADATIVGTTGRSSDGDLAFEPQMPGSLGRLFLTFDDGIQGLAVVNEMTGATTVVGFHGAGDLNGADFIPNAGGSGTFALIAVDLQGQLVRLDTETGASQIVLTTTPPIAAAGVAHWRCRIDLDGDGVANLFDFLAFQNLFDAGDPIADFDGDGELTIFDFLAFQNAFDAGCP